MSVVPSPLESGPAPANLQTSILNGNLRIASSGGQGQQNAVYTITGGPIISNVNLNLPSLAADDTIATLSANNNWTGIHTFAQGLSTTGPINTNATINSTSSITSGSVIAGTITATGNLVGGNISTAGNFNAANLITPGQLTVGTTATITGTINALTTTTTGTLNSGTLTAGNTTINGTHQVNGSHTVTGNVNLSTTSGNVTLSGPTTALLSHSINGSATVYGAANHYGPSMIFRNGFASEAGILNITVGSTSQMGCFLSTAAAQHLGFFGGSNAVGHFPAPQTTAFNGGSSGYILSDSTWTVKMQSALQQAYNALIQYGFINA